ncbi:MAG: Holliday junction branch migration protein RuvA [Synergistaceae bacterium]|jgi:Holliday junction DNA helicase RuvA|nr:Holliday junction branch migration protein RuvA [Synergistaceae bacterium]
MIRSLRGEVLSVTEMSVVLDVNGLGFDILCSRGALSLCTPGGNARLTTCLQVSEAGAFLYGFADERERELFLKITTIKGIGGRTGMMILGVLSADEIIRAVSLADASLFMRAPGVGRKTAERLCFELRSSLPKEFTSTLETAASASVGGRRSRAADTVGDALRELGFSQSDAAAALSVVRAALAEDFDKLDEEALLRAALKELQRK